jgi:hypothetical protein
MHCRLSQSTEPWKCRISLTFLTRSKTAVTVQFGDVIRDQSQVGERIRRAQRAVLSPNADHIFFLDKPEEEWPPAELLFTLDYVGIEISDHNLTNLSFFDLPGILSRPTYSCDATHTLPEGLIANAGPGNEGDVQLVEKMVSSYISRDSCLILLTINCECEGFSLSAYSKSLLYSVTRRLYDPKVLPVSTKTRSRRQANHRQVDLLCLPG